MNFPGECHPDDSPEREIQAGFMRTCLDLARRGRGRTSPNPMVGALLVREGERVGQGYHDHSGAPHAEVMALRDAGPQAVGATLYVNLEPCCHFGKTPPCVEEIIRCGVREVFSCGADPDPRVNGRGFQALRRAGIRVTVGLLEEEGSRLNESFSKFVRTRIPFLTVKGALSLDGKIATARGDSTWISGRESRLRVQELRYEADCIMVGLETLRKDDPRLTLRRPGGGQKKLTRVIVDSRLRVPTSARIFGTLSQGPIHIYTTRKGTAAAIRKLEQVGARVIPVRSKGGRVSLPAVLEDLGARGLTSVLLEGGGEVIGSAFREGLVDKVILFMAPRIIGGRDAPGLLMGDGFSPLDACPRIRNLRLDRIGEDIYLEGYPETVAAVAERRAQEKKSEIGTSARYAPGLPRQEI